MPTIQSRRSIQGFGGEVADRLAGLGLVGEFQPDRGEIFRIAQDPGADVGDRLLAGLRQVDAARQPPVRARDRRAHASSNPFQAVPALAQGAVLAGILARGHQQHRGVLGRQREAVVAAGRRHRDRQARLLIAAKLQPHVLERPEIAVMADRIGGFQQPDDHLERLGHHRVELGIGQLEQPLVGDQVARPDAQDRPALGQVVEKRDTLGDMERVVEGQAHHRGTELDPMRGGGRHRQRHLRRRHGLPAARMVLADEELVVIQLVRQVDELDVALERERRVLGRVVHRHHEEREFHGLSSVGIGSGIPASLSAGAAGRQPASFVSARLRLDTVTVRIDQVERLADAVGAMLGSNIAVERCHPIAGPSGDRLRYHNMFAIRRRGKQHGRRHSAEDAGRCMPIGLAPLTAARRRRGLG